ncbi:MAG TPA: beta-N-acetylhexosaminidase [Terracidiphilus sp.]|nr:beta-N-acetylhexosaminidase [Terracidiphilus sp.]
MSSNQIKGHRKCFAPGYRSAHFAPILMLLLLVIGGASWGQDNPNRAVRLNLMPLPSSIQAGQGFLPLNSHFRAGFSGAHDARVDAALDRFLARLDRQCGDIRRMQHAAAPGNSFLLTLQVAGPGQAVQSVEEDESYKLNVTPQQATLTAANDLGVMHGLETFLQLVAMQDGACRVPAVAIDDSPRFPWRGFMLDVVRHFEPVDEIEHTLDGMAIAKLNVFHWHLSDDQGFRAQSKKFPKLTESASGDLFYTQDQLREVVAYARARGIRVVPEFDMPGHSSSTALAYPEFGSGEDLKELPLTYGAPHAELDPANEKTYKFIDAFVGEMSEIFPDAYFHIGGDETEGKAWLANPRVKAFMDKKGFKTPADLQAFFNQRLLPILQKHHKKMVGWDEILNPALPKDIMVQSWRGVDSLSAGAVQGYTGILSAPYYLDHQKTSEQMFLDDVIPADTKLTPDQQKLILGGEICMWSEQINPDTIDSRIWPRSMAVAERFWSPQSDRDVADMYRRLRIASLELEDAGLRHLSGPERLRRNIAGSTHPEALDTLAAVLEPVNFGDREDTQRTDWYTALDRLVDVVVADPPARQQIAREVDTVLNAHGSDRALAEQRLRERFEAWQQAAPSLETAAQRNYRLNDIGDRARQLGQLAKAGLESLAWIDAHAAPPANWLAQQQAVLTDARKPSALVQFVFLPDLQKLVQAATTH